MGNLCSCFSFEFQEFRDSHKESNKESNKDDKDNKDDNKDKEINNNEISLKDIITEYNKKYNKNKTQQNKEEIINIEKDLLEPIEIKNQFPIFVRKNCIYKL